MRNPRLTMNGRLYRDPRGQWVYEETLFDRGRRDFFMAAACHIENEPVDRDDVRREDARRKEERDADVRALGETLRRGR
jgi:hypothetical protein